MTREKQEQQFTALFQAVRQHKNFNGVVLVAVHGQPVVCEAIGAAEYSSAGDRSLTTDSLFELASVSKPITALGMARLHQLGQLQWDDLVADWIPELPYPGITIRHLLCHSSGLPDYMELFAHQWDPSQFASNEDVLRMLIKHRPAPLFAPNESWMYSNTGYIVLAILMERISGQRYEDFLDEQIFKPLGMRRTQVYHRRLDPGPVPDDYAFGYVYRIGHGGYVLPDDLPELNYVKYLDGLQGDGMVHSTVHDLLRLDRALYDDQFMDSARRHLIFSPVAMNNGESFNYGMGWLIETDERLGALVHHTGGWPGYATWFKRYIDRDFTLIMLQNGERDHAYTSQLVESIEQILAGEDFTMPQPAETKNIIQLEWKNAEQQVGRYRFADEQGNALEVEVYVEQDQLHLKLQNGMVLLLLPLTATRYFEEQTATELEFQFSEEDQGMRLIWYSGEGEVAKRIYN